MSDKKMKKLTPVQQEYQTFAKAREPRRPVLFNCLKAFLVGGGICLLGQGVQDFFIWNFDFTEKTAGDPTVAVMIMFSVILTVAGVYDHIACYGIRQFSCRFGHGAQDRGICPRGWR